MYSHSRHIDPMATFFNHQVDAEKPLLGALIIDIEQINKINTRPEDFRLVRHRWIFEAMKASCPVSPDDHIFTKVINVLEGQGRLKEIGGSAYLTALVTFCDNSQDAPSYAFALREWAMKKSLYDKAVEMVQAAFSYDPLPDDIKGFLGK